MKSILLALALLLISAHCFADQPWKLIKDKSSITFTATYDGAAFQGIFSDFSVTLNFDTENLSNSQVESLVNVTSVNTQSRDRDQALSEPDWFYFKKFPQATFTSHSFQQVNEKQYIAVGILQIRDQKHEVSIPFDWTIINEQSAQLTSEFSLDRRTYDVGTGDWKNDKTIGFNVIVNWNLAFDLAN